MKLIFTVCRSRIGLWRCYKTQLLHLYLQFSTEIHSSDTNTSVFENKRPLCWNSTSVSILIILLLVACDFASAYQILPPFDRSATVLWRHIDFPWCRPYRRKSTSSFRFGDISRLRTSTTIFAPNINTISKSTAEILLLPVAEKWLPYWNSAPGFDFDFFIVINMWLSIGLPNFIRNRR